MNTTYMTRSSTASVTVRAQAPLVQSVQENTKQDLKENSNEQS